MRDADRQRRSSMPSAERHGGEVIVIPKALRMEWTDALMLDTELSAMQVRVAGVIGYHLNRHTGDTYVTPATIARILDKGVATVRRSIEKLEERGWLIVNRRELGSRKSDGRRVCGGRGIANTYRPACAGSVVAATDNGAKLAARAESRRQERCSPTTTFPASKVIAGDHLPVSERCSSESANVITSDHPTLKKNNPKRRAREAGTLDAALGAVLRQHIRDTDWRAWFAGVEVGGEVGRIVTLVAPSRLVRDKLEHSFGGAILAAFRNADASIERIAFIVEASRSSTKVARQSDGGAA